MPTTSLLMSIMYGASDDICGQNEFKVGKKQFRVDTRYARDVDTYETCIFVNHDSGTNVQHYKTNAAGVKGHKKWVTLLKKNPNTKLEEINEYGL